MMQPGASFEKTLSISDPFHGDVWLRVSRDSAEPVVRLVLAVQRAWDADLSLNARDAVVLADALGGTVLGTVSGTTADGAQAVLATEGDRLGVMILSDRLGDVLTLGTETTAVRDCLNAASTLNT